MSSHSALEDALSLLFAENVRAELVLEQTLAEGVMYVAVMRYTKAGESGSLTSVEQTAVVVHNHRFDLPDFTVSPKRSGLAGWVQRLVGMRDISFSDSPEFSRRYHLFGWKEAAVRGLFTKELRSSLEEQARWSARGGREWIALFQDRFVCESLNLHEFVDRHAECSGTLSGQALKSMVRSNITFTSTTRLDNRQCRQSCRCTSLGNGGCNPQVEYAFGYDSLLLQLHNYSAFKQAGYENWPT